MSALIPFNLHRVLLRASIRALPWMLLGLAAASWIEGHFEQLGFCLSLLGLGFYLSVCDELHRLGLTALRFLLIPVLGLAWLALEAWLEGLELGGGLAFPRLLSLLDSRPWLLVGSGALAQLSLEPSWQGSSRVTWLLVGSLLLPCLFLTLHLAGLRVSIPTVGWAVPWLLGGLSVPMQLLGQVWATGLLGSPRPAMREPIPRPRRRLRLLLIVPTLGLGAGVYFGEAVLLVQTVAALIVLTVLAEKRP